MQTPENRVNVATPPRGAMLLMVLGPCFIWCGEYIGSGEVILATRTGAIYGVALLWVPILAIFSKYWIGLAGAHYTVTTGEGMIDMMSRTPGPKNWVLWPVFVGQVCSGSVSTAALASAAAAFAGYFLPGVPQMALAWGAVILVIALVWSGLYNTLKHAMTLCVTLIVLGTLAVAVQAWPGAGEFLHGVFGFTIPDAPAWFSEGKGHSQPWREILPLLGWAAGGFASQVWYTYWVLGAGYGMANGRPYGEPCDEAQLAALDEDNARRVLGWRRIVTIDATLAVCIGIVVTCGFMIAGAGVLGPKHLAPEGNDVALQLSNLFSTQWGALGAHLFVLAGLAAMVSTMIGQFAGWPRLLADCARILFPSVKRYAWATQFRFILVTVALSNMLIVYTFGIQPVYLVQTGAILDGLLLTPLQALAVGWVLYRVMPKFFRPEIAKILRPHPILAAGLLLAFVVFSFVCVFRIGDMI
jgi:Mn2+/Fe2+ NRAMP family transporter